MQYRVLTFKYSNSPDFSCLQWKNHWWSRWQMMPEIFSNSRDALQLMEHYRVLPEQLRKDKVMSFRKSLWRKDNE